MCDFGSKIEMLYCYMKKVVQRTMFKGFYIAFHLHNNKSINSISECNIAQTQLYKWS